MMELYVHSTSSMSFFISLIFYWVSYLWSNLGCFLVTNTTYVLSSYFNVFVESNFLYRIKWRTDKSQWLLEALVLKKKLYKSCLAKVYFSVKTTDDLYAPERYHFKDCQTKPVIMICMSGRFWYFWTFCFSDKQMGNGWILWSCMEVYEA